MIENPQWKYLCVLGWRRQASDSWSLCTWEGGNPTHAFAVTSPDGLDLDAYIRKNGLMQSKKNAEAGLLLRSLGHANESAGAVVFGWYDDKQQTIDELREENAVLRERDIDANDGLVALEHEVAALKARGRGHTSECLISASCTCGENL